VKNFGLGYSGDQIIIVFNFFDTNQSGEIDYDEFLRALRGSMNSFRSSLVTKAFDKFDRDGNGQIDIHDITGLYNGKKHPDVLSGKKTEV